MSTDEMIEPLPCPKCGSPAITAMGRNPVTIKGKTVSAHQGYIVKCFSDTCDKALTQSYKTHREAIAAWNAAIKQ